MNITTHKMDLCFLGVDKMLPLLIIDEIRRREQLKNHERPMLELELPLPLPLEHEAEPDESDRGILIIQL